MSYIAKSFILDIADNWGYTSYLGIRSIEFYLNSTLFELSPSDFAIYFTSELNSTYDAEQIFDTSLSKIWSWNNTQWLSAASKTSNQRIIVVFNTAIEFDSVVVNNGHYSGNNTNQGAKNIVMSISPTQEMNYSYYGFPLPSDTIEIFSGQLAEHIASNVIDDQTLTLSTQSIPVPASHTAKSVVLDIADNWGNTTYTGIRQVDFYLDDKLVSVSELDIICYSSSIFSILYYPQYAFDTSLSRTDNGSSTQWLSGSGNPTNQRLICTFDSEITFNRIMITNSHFSGATTNAGAKNIEIYVSSDSIIDTVYGNSVSSSYLVFDNQLDEHIASAILDYQILELIDQSELISLTDMSLDIQAFCEVAKDIIIDVSAYYQVLNSFPTSIYTIGDIIQDAELDLILAEYTFQNMPLDIQAYFEFLTDAGFDIYTAIYAKKDVKFDLFAGLQALDDISLNIQTASEQIKNIFLDVKIADGIITGNTAIDISATDGNKTQSMGMNLLAVSTMPEFKSVYAIHLTSAIREI